MRIDVAERLKKARIALDISQKDVANELGVNCSVIRDYENGKLTPDIETFIHLCRMYKLNYLKLLTYYYGNPDGEVYGNATLADEILSLINTFDNDKLQQLRWILSGEHGKRVDPLIQLIITYLHIDIGSRIHVTEWLYAIYSSLYLQGRLVNPNIMEPDFQCLILSLQDARRAYMDGKDNYSC